MANRRFTHFTRTGIARVGAHALFISVFSVASLGGCSDTTARPGSAPSDGAVTNDGATTDDHDDAPSTAPSPDGGDASAPDADPEDGGPDVSIRDASAEADVRTRDRATDVPLIDAAACVCPVREAGEYGITYLPMQCACANFVCRDIEDAELDIPRVCRNTIGAEQFRRSVGCGRVAYEWISSHIGGWTNIYDEESGQMVGSFSGGDAPREPCNSFSYVYGEEFDRKCPNLVTCDLCGSDGGIPMCP